MLENIAAKNEPKGINQSKSCSFPTLEKLRENLGCLVKSIAPKKSNFKSLISSLIYKSEETLINEILYIIIIGILIICLSRIIKLIRFYSDGYFKDRYFGVFLLLRQ